MTGFAVSCTIYVDVRQYKSCKVQLSTWGFLANLTIPDILRKALLQHTNHAVHLVVIGSDVGFQQIK